MAHKIVTKREVSVAVKVQNVQLTLWFKDAINLLEYNCLSPVVVMNNRLVASIEEASGYGRRMRTLTPLDIHTTNFSCDA
jgi:hypothetical protein